MGQNAYKPPTTNKLMTTIFWLIGMCRPQMWLRGTASMIQSVMTLGKEMAIKNLARSMHFPSIKGFHRASIGTQVTALTTIWRYFILLTSFHLKNESADRNNNGAVAGERDRECTYNRDRPAYNNNDKYDQHLSHLRDPKDAPIEWQDRKLCKADTKSVEKFARNGEFEDPDYTIRVHRFDNLDVLSNAETEHWMQVSTKVDWIGSASLTQHYYCHDSCC